MESTSAKPGLHSRPERLSWLLASTTGMVLLAGLNTGWTGPCLPTIAAEQSIRLSDLGALFSMQFIGCIAALSIGKTCLDRIGIKNSLALSVLLIIFGFILLGVGYGRLALWAGGLLFGAGTGFNTIASTICVMRLSEGNSASALNRLHLFFGLGALLGPMIAWLAHLTPWTYHVTFLSGAAIALALLLLLFQSPDLPTRDRDRPAKADRYVLKTIILWAYALTMLFYVGIESGTAAWLFVFLRKAGSMPHLLASFGMSALWLGLTAGRFTADRLCCRYSSNRITLVSMILACCMIATVLAAPVIPAGLSWLTLLVVGLIGFGFGPIFPTVLAAANNNFKDAMPLVTTVVTFSAFSGGALFPWAAGLVFENAGMLAGMSVLLTGCLIMILAFMVAIFAGSSKQD